MKKLILFLLTATLLILPLSGCFADNQQSEGTTPANTTENTTPDSTTPESTEPDYNPGPDETTSEVTTPEETTLPDNSPNNNVPNDDDAAYIVVGSDASSGDPMSQYALSAKIPVEWNVAHGNIPILLSFGLHEGSSSNAYFFSNIIFEFGNNEKQFYVFKRMDIAEIEKPEYTVKCIYNEEWWVIGFLYTHTEAAELPLFMFSADSGYITIAMIEWEDDSTEKGKSGAGGGTLLYYKRDGEKIIMSVRNDFSQ